MFQKQAAGNEVVEDSYKLLPKYRDWGGFAMHFSFLPITVRAAWYLLPAYLGIAHPVMWPLVVLGLNILAMVLWRVGKPGKVKESLAVIKCAAIAHHMSFGMSLALGLEHHFRVLNNPVLSAVLAGPLAKQYGYGKEDLQSKLEVLEAVIEGSCWIVMFAASAGVHQYIMGVMARNKAVRERLDAVALAKKTDNPASAASRAEPAAAKPKDESEDSEDEDAVVVKGKNRGPVRRKA